MASGGETIGYASDVFTRPPLQSPWEDVDAAAAITAAGVTDEAAKAHYHQIVRAIKEVGRWADLENAYLLGTYYQASSTTLKSLTGTADATGTSTFSNYSAAFNGTTDKYLFANGNLGTAKTGQTFLVIYKNDGLQAVNAILSNYQGGSAKGPALSCGGAAAGYASGPTRINDVCALGCPSDGSSNVTVAVVDGVDQKYSFGALTFGDTTLKVFGNGVTPVSGALAELWCNNANFGLGANPNSSQFFDGEIVFAAVFNAGLSDTEIFRLKVMLERILTPTLTMTGSVIFEGNSLTGAASGGGTTWPAKLLAMAGWSGVTRAYNVALSGAWQTRRTESHYGVSVTQHAPWAKQDSLFFLLGGINDITGGLTSTVIIASLKRNVIRAKSDGFRVVLLTLTPVAPSGSGLSYNYDATKLGYIDDINDWILGEGSTIVDQVVDLNEITDTYPEFGDPTDDTYYTTGDGLHHNDAGRALIAAKVFAEVAIIANP